MLFGIIASTLFTISSAAPEVVAPCAIESASAAGDSLWLLCDRDRLLFSNNNGKNWQSVALPPALRFRAVHFLNNLRGFIAGDGGTLLASEDGGKHWEAVAVPAKDNLSAIHFTGDHGWIAGWGGVIMHSADGGRKWELQQTGVTQSLENLYFMDNKRGWAVGWAGTILRTVDGGYRWEKVKLAQMSWSLSSIYFRNPENGWAVGFGGEILRSRDGGATWQTQPSPIREWLKAITFDGSGRGWIATHSGMLVSDDQGDTWKYVPLDDSFALHTFVRTGGSIWAVGQLGAVRSVAPAKWQAVEWVVNERSAPARSGIRSTESD
jgi:photosystem II stability/assembly factor-like uncharacterized protein